MSQVSERDMEIRWAMLVIRRHDRIKLRWTDLKGQPREDWFGHFRARVIQHEYDHLDGICRVGDDSPADGTVPKRPAVAPLLAIAALAALGVRS